MKLSILKQRDKSFSYIFLTLVSLLGVSVLGNVAAISFFIKTNGDERVITTPMGFDQPFLSDKYSADIRLNNMMVRGFLNLRLNVTPETIDSQQEEILKYAAPGYRSELKRTLMSEAQYIKSNDVSSTFSITSMKFDPETGDTYVTGDLSASTTGGKLDLPDSEKNYVIKIQYINGQVILPLFSEYTPKQKS